MKKGFADYAYSESWVADVCAIGAGAGGGAAAAALAEAGLSVLVVEEGSHWRPTDFQQDVAWAYKHIYAGRGGRSAIGNTVIPDRGGRGVGGSTLINSAICFRPPEPVLEHWSGELGCHRLSVEAMKPRLDRVWRTLGVTVNPVQFQRENNLIFKLGADRLGAPGHWLARSAPTCEGCGVCYLGCPTGGKWSVDRTFLTEGLATGRLSIHGDCRVEAIDTAKGRVTAISGRTIDPRTIEPGGRFTVKADVFLLSAGPIGSPRLLRSNGLADDRICGTNLHLHPACGMLARFDHEIKPWSGVTQGYYVDRWERGYLLQTYTTSPSQTYAGMPWSFGSELLEAIRDLSHMAQAGPLVHDQDSKGKVGLAGLTYFVGDGDRRRVLAGLRETARIFFAAGAREVYAPVVGSRPIRGEHEIDHVLTDDIPARQLYLYASHPMGTCRMGADAAQSVVDPDGRVWGWENLYVADASVFPTSLGVNPQVTTMAVGLAVAEAMVERA